MDYSINYQYFTQAHTATNHQCGWRETKKTCANKVISSIIMVNVELDANWWGIF